MRWGPEAAWEPGIDNPSFCTRLLAGRGQREDYLGEGVRGDEETTVATMLPGT